MPVPCLVGVAQVTVRDQPGPEPLDLWERVAREAAAEARLAPERLGSIQLVYTESWQYDDPVGRLAGRLGAEPGHRRYSAVSGTAPHQLIGAAAAGIAAGEYDSALVAGAEALATRRVIRKRGEHVRWSHAADPRPPYGWERPPHDAELAHGLVFPVHTYPILETARRARLGQSLGEEARTRGELLAPMTTVAAGDTHAWSRVERTASEIATPSPENRYIGWPYTRSSVAFIDVDMAAAAVLMSDTLADRLGVPADQRVYLRGWAGAEDAWAVAARPDLGESPALRAAARTALRRSAVDLDDIAAFDLYSCFAVAVRAGCEALDLSPGDPRGLTVTGGLPYFGGPGSAYTLHSTVAMAGVLRERGGHGLVTAVGMHLTKHATAVWSTEPGPSSCVPLDGQGYASGVHETVTVPLVSTYEGPATVTGYTVAHDRGGAPEQGFLVVDLPGGARAYALVRDQGLLADAESRELVGETVHLRPGDGKTNMSTW